MEEETESSLLRRQLQMIVVQHLNAGKKVDSALDFSLNFTIAQERFYKKQKFWVTTGQSISSIGRVPIKILPGKRHIT